jgi:membrane dipeptidase
MGVLRVADSHLDLLLAVRHLRERGHEDPFGDVWLPQLRAGGVRLQVLPICTEEQFVGEGALRRCLLLLEEAHHLAAVHAGDVAIVESAAELDACLASGRIALVLAIEGAEPVGSSLELLDVLWRSGVRMCSLSWNRRTMLADGIAETDTGGRLTSLGVAAVRRLEDLGVMLDVSHLSAAGFDHVCEIATRPFIASHSSCRAVQDHPRNLADDQLFALAERGGFLALNAFGPFLAEGPATVADFVDHVEHAVKVMGPDHVGLGTDFIDDIALVVDPIFTGLLVDFTDIPPTRGLQRPADYPQLASALTERLGQWQASRVLFDNLRNFIGARL